MNSSKPSLISSSKNLKHAFSVGKNVVVVIDSAIVKHLGITEHETIFQEEKLERGILLRIKRSEAS